MSYVESNLGPGERVIHSARHHWIMFFTIRSLLTFGIAPLIDYLTNEFAVTNRRVMIKVGLISRKTLELNLAKVESIGVDQGILGRIFGFGTVIVNGTGSTREPFRHIAAPLQFRSAVTTAVDSPR